MAKPVITRKPPVDHSNKVIVEMGWDSNFLLAPEHVTALLNIMASATRYESEYMDGCQLLTLGTAPSCTIKTQGVATYVIVDGKEHSKETIDDYKTMYKATVALRGGVRGVALTFEEFLASNPTPQG